MATTRRQLCELIIRALAGGQPSDDFTVTIGQVNIYLSGAIAAAAVKDLQRNSDIEGVSTIGDAFYTTTKGLTITKDSDTGYYNATLPQPPISISRGLDITSLKFLTTSGVKRTGYRVGPVEFDYMNELPIESSKIYYLVTGNKLVIQSLLDLTYDKAMVTMVSSQSNLGSGLDDPITLPDNYIGDIIGYMASVFNIQLSVPIDTANDGAPTPQIK